ncbi:flavin reductase family protein [Desulfuromonas carbonis]|uniref:flavin reductase family protein n=1 Tax=Desulfuromonas sp. DDH964 TaxID=1823759 RepID=UPI00078BAC0D|nr:flavin reductase family protein [Desulfuromonas sp. DDH964]AMV72393.1 flavoredoxin [Desulfuromonas sp. DDH964]
MIRTSLGPGITFFPQPMTLVGSVDSNGACDLMAASWVGVVSKTPPTLALSLHHGRQSYANIAVSGEFSVSLVPESMMAAADFCGLASGRDHEKFNLTGLTPQPGTHIKAPSVAESPLCVECRVASEVVLGDYRLLLGEILDIQVAAAAIDSTGRIDPHLVAPLVYLGGIREYWGLGGKIGTAYSDGRRFFATRS